jgi:hypothetical protein
MGLLNVGAKVGSKFGGTTGLAMGAIGLAGVAKGIGPSAKEAVLDAAFNDPYADETFMGRPMSSGFLGAAATHGTAGAVGLGLGAMAIGGLIGGGAAAKLIPKNSFRGTMIAGAGAIGAAVGASGGGMSETLSVYGPDPTVGANLATAGIGTALGGAIGGLGYGYGKSFKKAAIGTAIGATIGGLGGAAVVPGMAMSRVRDNRQLLSSSPYSTSLATAQALNASGDIVLGMHNSRKSY